MAPWRPTSKLNHRNSLQLMPAFNHGKHMMLNLCHQTIIFLLLSLRSCNILKP